MSRLTDILALQKRAARSAPSTAAERIGKLRALRAIIRRLNARTANACIRSEA